MLLTGTRKTVTSGLWEIKNKQNPAPSEGAAEEAVFTGKNQV